MRMRSWIGMAVAAVGLAAGCASTAKTFGSAEVVERLQKAAGLDRWERIEAIRFTFSVRKGDIHVSRSWRWEPKTHRVWFEGKGPDGKPLKISYNRTRLAEASPAARAVDPNFINDTFWLLAPLHLGWAKDVTIEDFGSHSLPIGDGAERRIIVTYASHAGGYTPGDVYELYVDDRWRIVQWVYRHGGRTKPSLVCKWDAYRPVGPLRLSLARTGVDKSFHLIFSDVAVRLAGDVDWMPAPPAELAPSSQPRIAWRNHVAAGP